MKRPLEATTQSRYCAGAANSRAESEPAGEAHACRRIADKIMPFYCILRRFFVWFGFLAAVAWMGGAAPQIGSASEVRPRAAVCGTPAASHDLVEPPDVDVWTLPLNAAGEHELVLSVHSDGLRYCYRYALNGAVQTVSPTIRVRRGEHFAIRIVNDLAGKSKGAATASASLPPCMPMAMPRAKTTHYVGYLNHVIDDRFMHVPPVDTNLHLHGFEGPAAEENIFLSSLSTPMHACEYHVTIPRTQPPGMYLYHPHAHGASGIQVALGLDGAWIVEPDEPQLPRSAEHVILLRYRVPTIFDNPFAPNEDAFVTDAVTHEGGLIPAQPVAYDPFNPPPWPVTYPMSAGGVTLDWSGCNGLSSEALLSIDGSDAPASLRVPGGQPQLLRVLNGSSDSAAALQMHDSSGRLQPLHVVGIDGVPVSGNMAHPLAQYISMNQVMLTAMSRADILIAADPGATLTLSSEHYCEGKDAFFQMHHDLLRIAGTAGETTQTAAMPSTAVRIADTPAARLVAYARAHPSLIRRRRSRSPNTSFRRTGKSRCTTVITLPIPRTPISTSIRSGRSFLRAPPYLPIPISW
ncbi:MAG: hypothetical protein WB615_00705 [Candidatus Tumulicola sp.]